MAPRKPSGSTRLRTAPAKRRSDRSAWHDRTRDPPGFVVRTGVQKAAWDNRFRLARGVESGGWLRYASTTARGEIWIAGVPPRGPWPLSINHPGVAGELAVLPSSPLPGPSLATFKFNSLTA